MSLIKNAKKTIATEGIKEGLTTINYQVKAILKEHLFTRIIVSYNKTYFFQKRNKPNPT